MRYMLGLVVMILLLGCQTYPDLPEPNYTYTEEDPELRPDIPRNYEPEPEDIPQPEQPRPNGSVFVDNVAPPGVSLELPIGENLSEHHPIITSNEFPLLRHPAIAATGSRPAIYLEQIIFDLEENSTGRLIFGKDEDSEEIGTFLFFEEDKQIFEYRVIFQTDPFWALEGRDIQLLGHTYVIAEATNESVSLYGRDVDSNLFFSDGKKLVVDSKKQRDTIVSVDEFMFSYRVIVDGQDEGGIRLSAGESLVDNLGQDRMASRILDIRYEGTEELPAAKVKLDKTRHGYTLYFDTVGGEVELPLIANVDGELVLGREGERLHVEPCSRSTYCITEDDLVLLRSGDGRAFVLTYAGSSDEPPEIIMRSSGNRYSYEFLGDPGRNAFTDIVQEDIAFRAEIGPFDNDTGFANITIRNARFWDEKIPLLGGYWIELGELTEDSLSFDLVIPRQFTYDRDEERTSVNISYDGEWLLTVDGVPFEEEDDSEDGFGQTTYGVVFLLDKKDRSLDANQAEELEILIPLAQVSGSILLEG